jgi:type II secretory pathway pseudopilin PulG
VSRRAFSFIEVIVVAGLLVVLVGGFVLYRVSGQKQSMAIEFRAAALQSAQLAITRLQRDVASLVPTPLAAQNAPAIELTRVSDASSARGLPLDANDALLTEQIRWAFDPKTHMLSRNGEPLRGVLMETVDFTYFPARPGETTPPFGDTLMVRMVCVPVEALGRVTADTPKVEFTTAFHATQGTLERVHEDWSGD